MVALVKREFSGKETDTVTVSPTAPSDTDKVNGTFACALTDMPDSNTDSINITHSAAGKHFLSIIKPSFDRKTAVNTEDVHRRVLLAIKSIMQGRHSC